MKYIEVSPGVWSDGKTSFKAKKEGPPREVDPDTGRFIPRFVDGSNEGLMWRQIETGQATQVDYVEPVPHYADLRREAYGAWGDQLDMQFHDLLDGTTTWVDHVAGVKAAHPKP
jgi:hypothetical protein